MKYKLKKEFAGIPKDTVSYEYDEPYFWFMQGKRNQCYIHVDIINALPEIFELVKEHK